MASGLPMMLATDLEASAGMAEVSTPSRFTSVDTFRHSILARFLFLFLLSAIASGWLPSPPLLCSAHYSLSLWSVLLLSLSILLLLHTKGISSALPELIIGCLGLSMGKETLT